MKPHAQPSSASHETEAGSAPLDQQVHDLAILNAIAEALNSAIDVEQALTRTLVLVADLLHLRTGWIWLLDPETHQFYSAAVHNLPPYLQTPVRMTGNPCHCLQEFQHGRLKPQNIAMLECSRLRTAVRTGAVEATHGLRYHASIPLYSGTTPLGIMNVTSSSWRELTPMELHLLSTVAYQVGIAIERARLTEEQARLARAEERERIAREIHDTLAQRLTAIALHLEGALPHLESDPELSRSRLQRALATTRESLEEARRSVLNLRTIPLAGKPLAEAITALGRTFTAETGVRVHVRAAQSPSLPLRVEAELFRIAQEALANVRSHADAHEVTITLRKGVNNVRLSIRDDGRGFDPQMVDVETTPGWSLDRHRVQPLHYGIIGMRERARLVGGRLRVQSRPGNGTVVTVSVPLSQEDS
jgi:two-component system NarL family sensor kinase